MRIILENPKKKQSDWSSTADQFNSRRGKGIRQKLEFGQHHGAKMDW